MSAEVAVRVQNVSKTYRIYDKPEHRLVQMATLGRVRRFKEFSALKDVSLEVRRGETVGIVGRNGCGKSTLLQIICGTLQPSGGHVEVNGRVAALLELGAGFNGEFTGRENVYMNGAILGFSREEMDARFDQIAAFAGIGDFIERPVKTYSSGMFVRLAFAVATAVEPDILIVDEALAVGDEAFQRKCFARIEAIKERGGTILFVSHSAQSVVQLCDRAVLLDAGERLLEGEPKLVTTQYQRLIHAEVGHATDIRESILRQGFDYSSPKAEQASASHFDVDYREDEFFDEALQTESAVEFGTRGACISNVRISTPSGRPVNVVVSGRKYLVQYAVRFTSDADHVGFGVSFRTINGLKISGLLTSDTASFRIESVAKDSLYNVSFEFECRLNIGTYIIGCGVVGTVNDSTHHLHRILDSYLFKVSKTTSAIQLNSIVDLALIPKIFRERTE